MRLVVWRFLGGKKAVRDQNRAEPSSSERLALEHLMKNMLCTKVLDRPDMRHTGARRFSVGGRQACGLSHSLRASRKTKSVAAQSRVTAETAATTQIGAKVPAKLPFAFSE